MTGQTASDEPLDLEMEARPDTGQQGVESQANPQLRESDELRETERSSVEPAHDPSQEPSPDDRGDSAPEAERYFLVTNRFNLLSLLGARLLMPAQAFRKYYADPLERVPGRVPLLVGLPGDQLLSEAAGSAPNSFPVLIEVASLDGLSVQRGQDGLVLVEGFVPWSSVRGIHFPTDVALREHLARAYANIHRHDDLLRVSPELFVGGNRDVSWPEVGDSTATASTVDWNRLDRARGALNGLRAASRTPDAISRLGELLNSARASAPASARAPAEVGGAEWLKAVRTMLALHPAGEPPPSKRRRGAPKPDDLLFAAALEVFVGVDVQEAWSPRTLVGAIAEKASEGATARAQGVIAKNMGHVRAVIAGERDFSPFKATGTGLATAKALLLVLLREDLKSLLDWSVEETNADSAVMQTAAALAGALRGLSRENVELRLSVFDDLTMAMAVEEPVSSVNVVEEGDEVVLNLGTVPLARATRPRPGAQEMIASLDGDLRLRAVRIVCESMGWQDVLVTTVKWTGDVTITMRDGKCVMSGNADSVKTEILEERLSAHLAADPCDDATISAVRTLCRPAGSVE